MKNIAFTLYKENQQVTYEIVFFPLQATPKWRKNANMVGFLKAINDADTDSQIAIFLQILAHCVMGFFSDYTMYDVHFSLQDTIQSWFCIRGKKI